MIAILDYGLGNIKAFAAVFHKLGVEYGVARNASELASATKIVLPGVGAFDKAMSLLNESGMRETLEQRVARDRMPILGVCVGMQILAQTSEEGTLAGLGLIEGSVRSIATLAGARGLDLPHMGWNTVQFTPGERLASGLSDPPEFYFLHSYYFDCAREEDVIARVNYGATFPCAVRRGNVYGVQFHPEKSHHNGVAILNSFAEL
jgi:glutamine amidotransferase